jgi:hypothetical protein
MSTQLVSQIAADVVPQYEFIDCKTLARRWCLPESWIREQVRSRSTDPLPHIRFGKYVRFPWGSPELIGWSERRLIASKIDMTSRVFGKARVQ